MPVSFATSQTRENLMRAFAGESQARNRYTFAAGQAKSQNLYVLQWLFTFTANQEKEHAEIFYKHLTDCAGETIQIDGGYPVDISTSMAQLLKMAHHNEYEEYDVVYKNFGETAKEEGFLLAADSFLSIAKIEKIHGDRFQLFADLMERDALFTGETEESWICLNCGHIHTGKSAPAACPVCHHNQGYFIRGAMMPLANPNGLSALK